MHRFAAARECYHVPSPSPGTQLYPKQEGRRRSQVEFRRSHETQLPIHKLSTPIRSHTYPQQIDGDEEQPSPSRTGIYRASDHGFPTTSAVRRDEPTITGVLETTNGEKSTRGKTQENELLYCREFLARGVTNKLSPPAKLFLWLRWLRVDGTAISPTLVSIRKLTTYNFMLCCRKLRSEPITLVAQ